MGPRPRLPQRHSAAAPPCSEQPRFAWRRPERLEAGCSRSIQSRPESRPGGMQPRGRPVSGRAEGPRGAPECYDPHRHELVASGRPLIGNPELPGEGSAGRDIAHSHHSVETHRARGYDTNQTRAPPSEQRHPDERWETPDHPNFARYRPTPTRPPTPQPWRMPPGSWPVEPMPLDRPDVPNVPRSVPPRTRHLFLPRK